MHSISFYRCISSYSLTVERNTVNILIDVQVILRALVYKYMYKHVSLIG